MRNDLIDRRTLLKRGLTGGAALSLSGLVPDWAASVAEAKAASPGFRNSLCVSPFTETMLADYAFTDGTFTARSVADMQRLFMRHGGSEVYARFATKKVAPQKGVDIGFARGLERAALAKQLGLPFNPELMFNGNYGDQGARQDPPDFRDYPEIAAALEGPWTSLTLDQMARHIRAYAAAAAKQIVQTGVTVNYWDLGNEVECGMAGVTPPGGDESENQPPYTPPDKVDPAIGQQTIKNLNTIYSEAQRIDWSQRHLWPYIARLLAAAREGILSVQPHAKFSTHISLTNMNTAAVPLAFWQCMQDNGYLPDVIGTSWYPCINTISLDAFKENFTQVSEHFGRPVFLAEFAYASAPGAIHPLPNPPYLLTESDQDRFTRDLVGWGYQSGVLQGLRWWAPDLLIPGWQPLSLFRFPVNGVGVATPAIAAVGDTAPPPPPLDAPPTALRPGQAFRVDLGHGRGLRVRFAGRYRHAVKVKVAATGGPSSGIAIELRRHGVRVARAAGFRAREKAHSLLLRRPSGRAFPAGRYTLVVRQHGTVVAERTVRLP
jgi:hypothetical protein